MGMVPDMKRYYLSAWVAITLLTALASLFGGHSAAFAATAVASDPLATPAAQAELTWLANLPNQSFARRVVSGYFGGYSGTADPSTGKNWASELQEITGTGPASSVLTLTGRQPGILACDYGAGWTNPGPVPTTIDTSCDSDLANWARPSSGGSGLVSVSVHMPNPDAAATSPGQPLPSATFEQIYDPTTASGVTIQNTFNGYLNDIAAGLQVLQSDNVPVLFRPFLEGNGNWFWWDGQTPNDFKALWRYTYNYLTSQEGLHNLLWVYSPSCNGSANAPANPGATADPAAEYPADAFADIVGLSCYFADGELAQPGLRRVRARLLPQRRNVHASRRHLCKRQVPSRRRRGRAGSRGPRGDDMVRRLLGAHQAANPRAGRPRRRRCRVAQSLWNPTPATSRTPGYSLASVLQGERYAQTAGWLVLARPGHSAVRRADRR